MNETSSNTSAFGALLRHFRGLSGLSQLALATRVETTTRHLSYLENGRSRPGRDLVLRLGQALSVPLSGRNDLLVAAGLTPEFPAREFNGPELQPYRQAILQVISAIHPFPAFVVDGAFCLVECNQVARMLLPENALSERLCLVDAFLAPGPARERIENFAEVAWSWHGRLLRATRAVVTPEVEALRKRMETYLEGLPRPSVDATGDPIVCPRFRFGETTVRTIGMTMQFGPSRDVTLEGLSVDVLCPRDEEAERFFRNFAAIP
jgi:transcriptional regulator with XRE-family HTH domain